MRTCTLACALVAAGLATTANADTDSKINFHSSIRGADGSRIELTGSFRADLDANGNLVNEASVEVEIQEAKAPGPPQRLQVSGFAAPARSIPAGCRRWSSWPSTW